MRRLSKHLSPEENDVWRRYHKRGCSQYVRCKLNQVNLDMNTTQEHRMGILNLAFVATMDGHNFITEAVPNNDLKRRVDFVNLTLDIDHEIETNKRVKKHGAKTTYVERVYRRNDTDK